MTARRAWWPVRLALVITLAWWALVLGGSADTFGSNHAYDHLARWGSQRAWAWYMGLGAALCGAGLLYRRRWLRVTGAIVACALQSAITVSFGGGTHVVTGFGAYLGLTWLATWLVWRDVIA